MGREPERPFPRARRSELRRTQRRCCDLPLIPHSSRSSRRLPHLQRLSQRRPEPAHCRTWRLQLPGWRSTSEVDVRAKDGR
eukprot:scaffold1410_cov242-Pinguiococcus_pyrenoidosus.AAC.7